MELRDIAVTVRELAQGGFGWVLLEGTGEDGPFASYARLQVSERVYDSYRRRWRPASACFAASIRRSAGREGAWTESGKNGPLCPSGKRRVLLIR